MSHTNKNNDHVIRLIQQCFKVDICKNWQNIVGKNYFLEKSFDIDDHHQPTLSLTDAPL